MWNGHDYPRERPRLPTRRLLIQRVSLQRQWLSLCSDRIQAQPCVQSRQRAAVCALIEAVHSTWQARCTVCSHCANSVSSSTTPHLSADLILTTRAETWLDLSLSSSSACIFSLSCCREKRKLQRLMEANMLQLDSLSLKSRNIAKKKTEKFCNYWSAARKWKNAPTLLALTKISNALPVHKCHCS